MARRMKPPVADWIQRERKRLGLSVDQLVERLDLIGVHVGRQTIQVWESYADRKPKPDTLDALERIFDSPAPNRETGSAREDGADLGALVSAIQAQTEMMKDLIHELRLARQEPAALQEAVAAIQAELERSERLRPVDPERSADTQSSGVRRGSLVPAGRG